MKKHPQPIYDNDWESLEEQDTIRVHCNHWKCEDKNDAFTITKIIGGCIYNCYRCGTSGVVFKGSNPQDALERIHSLRACRHTNYSNTIKCGNSVNISLPIDFVPLVTEDPKIPAQAYAWLYAYELDETDFDIYHIGYSPKLERVIIPFYKDNKLIAWQGRDIFYKRNIDLYKRKLIKNTPLKYYREYNNTENRLYYNINNNINNNIILVEDIISCIKVYNKFKYNITALLNSTLNNSIIKDLNLYKYDNVYIWLDPDAQTKALQGALRWKSFGINTKCIRTDTDPKDVPYTKMEL